MTTTTTTPARPKPVRPLPKRDTPTVPTTRLDLEVGQ